MAKSLIVCDCEGSMALDAETLSKATGCGVAASCTALCTTQLDRAAAALTAGDTVFCCTQ